MEEAFSTWHTGETFDAIYLSWKEPPLVKDALMSLNSSLLPSLFKLTEPITLTDWAFILHTHSSA